MSREDLVRSYDRVAAEYAERFSDELRHKPLDRALLDCFADEVRCRGAVLDVGCGPGQLARYLHGRGLAVTGVDLSPAMAALAAQRSPGIDFRAGSMLGLPFDDGAFAGVAAFYCIVHLAQGELPAAFREFHRVLRPGGLAIVSFHVGAERVHLDEWWGHEVSLDFHFFEVEEVTSALERAGLTVEARLTRKPYAAVEHPSTRGYVLARRSG
ncbi:MAG: class I SAM-dependent methyltransferase [Polyangiaceae bacterium]|nr:class I SAM-dependent methyltransferase [Polyangiaceae bacterium]